MLSDMDMDIGLLLIYDKNVITLKLQSGAYTDVAYKSYQLLIVTAMPENDVNYFIHLSIYDLNELESIITILALGPLHIIVHTNNTTKSCSVESQFLFFCTFLCNQFKTLECKYV